jgi:hypothetical protein
MKLKMYILILLIPLFWSCQDEVFTTTPSDSFVKDQPIEMEINGNAVMLYPFEVSSSSANWGYSYSSEETGATSDWDGQANTDSILQYYGDTYCAASICDSMTAYGYTDWYLPAKNELEAIYQHFSATSGIFQSTYWSSTESSADEAWKMDFSEAELQIATKSNYNDVLAIRKVN